MREQRFWHHYTDREHHMTQAEENGVSLREAATRVFSNASGSYSSNVNLAVENSSWQDEQQLQEMYLKRKSFAFNSDRCARHAPPGCKSDCVQLKT